MLLKSPKRDLPRAESALPKYIKNTSNTGVGGASRLFYPVITDITMFLKNFNACLMRIIIIKKKLQKSSFLMQKIVFVLYNYLKSEFLCFYNIDLILLVHHQ